MLRYTHMLLLHMVLSWESEGYIWLSYQSIHIQYDHFSPFNKKQDDVSTKHKLITNPQCAPNWRRNYAPCNGTIQYVARLFLKRHNIMSMQFINN